MGCSQSFNHEVQCDNTAHPLTSFLDPACIDVCCFVGWQSLEQIHLKKPMAYQSLNEKSNLYMPNKHYSSKTTKHLKKQENRN
eukprot:2201706-Amphidinium_carterae.1